MTTLDLHLAGNGVLAGLIDPEGTLVWLCWPGLDGDPLFCRLLSGEARGGWTVRLQDQVEARVVSAPDAAGVVTRLRDAHGGVVEVLDLAPMHDPPRPEWVRVLRPLAGAPRLAVRVDAHCDWGARRATPEPDGRLPGVTPAAWLSHDLPPWALGGDPFPLERVHHLVLAPEPVADVAAHAGAAVERTTAWWERWFSGLHIPSAAAAVVRPAARALKLCCDAHTGGIVAALTTSIPEEPGSGRTWDYRYCWLRDAYFSMRALARLGDEVAVQRYGRWLAGVVPPGADPLQPLYRLDGTARLEERFADALAGYRGEGPVRVGNAASDQIQHDVFGQAVLCGELAGTSDPQRRAALAERAWQVWDRPDAGVWEYRGIAHVHTSSAAFCWAALDGAARAGGPGSATWRQRADTVQQALLRRAWSDELGALSGAFETPLLDASVLLLPQLGLLPWTDPRFVATVEVMDRTLLRSEHGRAHMMRYRAADDFGRPHMAFTACSFWAIQALIGVGRREEAERRFQDLLACRSAAGLLSEDLDPSSGEAWGNTPQTYCAVGLVECALDLVGETAGSMR